MAESKTEENFEKIQIILRQTDYSEEIAREKLKNFNFDHILVIKTFMGITEKKAPEIKSVNQEKYRQMRYRLDSSMREFNFKKEQQTAEDKSV